MGRLSVLAILGLAILAISLHDVQVSAEVVPSESECRPYIEKAINELKGSDSGGDDSGETKEDLSAETLTKEGDNDDSGEKTQADTSGEEGTAEKTSAEVDSGENADETQEGKGSGEENATDGTAEEAGSEEEISVTEGTAEVDDDSTEQATTEETSAETTTPAGESQQADEPEEDHQQGSEEEGDVKNKAEDGEESSNEEGTEATATEETAEGSEEENQEGTEPSEVLDKEEGSEEQDDEDSNVENATEEEQEEGEGSEEITAKTDGSEEEKEDEHVKTDDSDENDSSEKQSDSESEEDEKSGEKREADDSESDDSESEEEVVKRGKRDVDAASKHDVDDDSQEKTGEDNASEEVATDEDNAAEESKEESGGDSQESKDNDSKEADQSAEGNTPEDDGVDSAEAEKAVKGSEEGGQESEEVATDAAKSDDGEDSEEDTQPEDDLLWEGEIPTNLRSRRHIHELLYLDNEFEDREAAMDHVAEIILKDIKRIYENAIKPLEVLYKYRDLSNRHFGDPEIFSKPLILFMGPWSGGKSTIINYLTENEYTNHALRSGAEPSPAYFNILMHGEESEVLDGTQLAADWTFSGLQKFGQGLEDRLRGLKLPHKLLEKVNIVEIPGILEVRKQVSRLFPFNDACQWFIDRADIIFLVYDPAKLDVGPETEAILDQLKGREYQTRIILNKADVVKPEELLRVQSALIWNISPLMSSAQPPVMYTTSLWSHPYEPNAPVRLFHAQERAFLKDIRTAIDKRIENKIASARRFAVRVRNHAKMVDCYLNTYYNHKTLFGNKKRIADQIIESPQDYHIYEGLSTLTNISRYDLPDPEVYRDFFRLNPLYDFKKLSQTCTYFRGCPINKLDVAIAYDLPELVGKYKKMAESALAKVESSDDSHKGHDKS